MLLLIAADTGRTGDVINAVILGFLIVAALLAVSTIWFWRHTDPRRRRGRVVDVQPIEVRVDGHVPAPGERGSVWSDAPVSSQFHGGDAGLSDDDWARMTAPNRRGGGSSIHGRG